MNEPHETTELRIKHRPHITVSLEIPTDVLETLEEVAEERDMSLQALLRFYIGRGLREDKPRMYAPRKANQDGIADKVSTLEVT